jgi:hypothetical protein
VPAWRRIAKRRSCPCLAPLSSSPTAGPRSSNHCHVGPRPSASSPTSSEHERRQQQLRQGLAGVHASSRSPAAAPAHAQAAASPRPRRHTHEQQLRRGLVIASSSAAASPARAAALPWPRQREMWIDGCGRSLRRQRKRRGGERCCVCGDRRAQPRVSDGGDGSAPAAPPCRTWRRRRQVVHRWRWKIALLTSRWRGRAGAAARTRRGSGEAAARARAGAAAGERLLARTPARPRRSCLRSCSLEVGDEANV